MYISAHETAWLKNDGAQMALALGVKKNDSVLDYGCGEGRYTIPVSQVVGEKGSVFSVERDAHAISTAQTRLPVFSDSQIVTFLQNDTLITTDILADTSIDVIFAFDVLQYVEDWDALFRYFHRVIKSGGIVCIYPAEIPHPGSMDMKIVTAKMKTAGFQYEKSTPFRMMHNVDMVDDLVYSFSAAK